MKKSRRRRERKNEMKENRKNEYDDDDKGELIVESSVIKQKQSRE